MLRHRIRLGDFQSLRPRFSVPQSEALEWLAQIHACASLGGENAKPDSELLRRMRTLLLRFGCKPEKISARGSEFGDAVMQPLNSHPFFRISAEKPSGPNMQERMRFFSEIADQVVRDFYTETKDARDLNVPDQIIHVTCTGYVSPSAVQKVVAEKRWQKTTITHAYHMGCYAAFPAMRLAVGQLAANQNYTKVDIVHNELCTLHLNPNDHSPEQLVVQSLFADGHIRYRVSPIVSSEDRGLELLNIHELVVPDTVQHMTWAPASHGMHMTLSKDVPGEVAKVLKTFLETLCSGTGYSLGELQQVAQFAIHPGGPKIIDSVEQSLDLRREQTRHSHDVLFEYGNMSSATAPHIWQRMAGDSSLCAGTPVISLAFGPGLTVFGALFRKL